MPLLLTDTTFRDAHQSLLATRVRTRDMLRLADAYSRLCPRIFSIEMWGGATFDTSMRFLKEDPWERLAQLRERIPNILFQMLLRGSNAVGYTSYPDNVVRAFIKESAAAGIDLFRVFDALNWIPNMEVALEAVRDEGALCEAAICYTGDILDPKRTKYNLVYYVNLARELAKRGANLIAIKDMSGLCKPYAAERLIKALREAVGVPIHFHTHDIGGAQAASIFQGAAVGLDVADGAVASMSGLTSQPSLNAIVESLRFTPRETGVDPAALIEISRYWEEVRSLYAPFEAGLRGLLGRPVRLRDAGRTVHEPVPAGQGAGPGVAMARGVQGLCRRQPALRRHHQGHADLEGRGRHGAFPRGQQLDPGGHDRPRARAGVPRERRRAVRGTARPAPRRLSPAAPGARAEGAALVDRATGQESAPADVDGARTKAEALLGRPANVRDALSYLLYPRVFPDLAAHERSYSDTSILPTAMFFYGPDPGAENLIEIEPGKTLIVKLLAVGEPHADGKRTVFFELNGQPREVEVVDRSLASAVRETPRPTPTTPTRSPPPCPASSWASRSSPAIPSARGRSSSRSRP